MRTPRFYCPRLSSGQVELDEQESSHAWQSLRLRPGDPVALFDGKGQVARGTLRAQPATDAPRESAKRRPRRRTAIVSIEHIEQIPPPGQSLTLVAAGCKGPRLTWLVEKCTELGVTRIVLAEFERSVVHTSASHAEKLCRTAIEACKQSGRAWLPNVEAGVPLADALSEQGESTLLVADLAHDAAPLADWLSAHRHARRLVAIVGPEGGLTETELGMLRTLGAQPIRLAEHVLRVETAAVSIAANWAARSGSIG